MDGYNKITLVRPFHELILLLNGRKVTHKIFWWFLRGESPCLNVSQAPEHTEEVSGVWTQEYCGGEEVGSCGKYLFLCLICFISRLLGSWWSRNPENQRNVHSARPVGVAAVSSQGTPPFLINSLKVFLSILHLILLLLGHCYNGLWSLDSNSLILSAVLFT